MTSRKFSLQRTLLERVYPNCDPDGWLEVSVFLDSLAKEITERPEIWGQHHGAYGIPPDDTQLVECEVDDPFACKWCAAGLIDNRGPDVLTKRVAGSLLAQVIPGGSDGFNAKSMGCVPNWNDDADRKPWQVARAFRAGAALALRMAIAEEVPA